MRSCQICLWVAIALQRCISAQPLNSFEVWSTRNYTSWENPLHSELFINGRRVNLFTSEQVERIGALLQPGWNTIAVRTTPQEAANKENDLRFQIGPVRRNSQGRKIMSPVFWQFRNGTDWTWQNGKYTHAAGPHTTQLELAFTVYIGDLVPENQEIAAGDYVAQAHPQYESWNSRLTATVVVNGTILTSFVGVDRQVRITPYLRPGKNDIRLITNPVKNALRENDLRINVSGPAQWASARARFEFKPALELQALQGWIVQPVSGKLLNRAAPGSDTLERAVPLLLNEDLSNRH